MTTFKNFVNGDWISGGDRLVSENPSDTNDIVGELEVGSTKTVQDAIDAANASQAGWAATSPVKRADILDAIGTELIARKSELGDLLAREEGKTLTEAVGEADRAGHFFKYFAAEAYRFHIEGYQSLRPGVTLEVRRLPIGVVAAITPWNFPLAIPAWKVAPALAYGNSVVFKPSELVPGCAAALADIIQKSGLPDGVFNMVMGDGAQVGQALIESPDVHGVTFTGSTTVGQKIGAAVFSRGGRIQLEMGGKNPLVVLDDADLNVAVDAAVNGSYFSTGQRCTASSRLIVTPGIHDRFVEALKTRMQDLVIGDARHPETQIGPLVSSPQRQKVVDAIHDAKANGAHLAIGGDCPERPTPGWYMTPALLTETQTDTPINRMEVFGPLAAVICAEDFEHALAVANDTDYGLSAGICSTDPAKIEHFVSTVQAGMAQVNLPTAGMDFHAPFTGQKFSAFGPPEKGTYTRDFFTAAKVVHARYVPPITFSGHEV